MRLLFAASSRNMEKARETPEGAESEAEDGAAVALFLYER